MMRAVIIVAGVLLLGACAADGEEAAEAPLAQARTETTAPPVSATAVPATTEASTTTLFPAVTRPDANVIEFRAAAAAISMDLADERTVERAENICLDTQQGKDEATIVRNTAARFELDEAAATQLVAAAREHLCA